MTIISSQQRTETIIKVPGGDLTRKLAGFNLTNPNIIRIIRRGPEFLQNPPICFIDKDSLPLAGR